MLSQPGGQLATQAKYWTQELEECWIENLWPLVSKILARRKAYQFLKAKVDTVTAASQTHLWLLKTSSTFVEVVWVFRC